jgi:hypothetical protein
MTTLSDTTKVCIFSSIFSGITISSASYSGVKDWKTLGLVGASAFVISGGLYKCVPKMICKFKSNNSYDGVKKLQFKL